MQKSVTVKFYLRKILKNCVLQVMAIYLKSHVKQQNPPKWVLFSQNIFYITHKCICQQIELNTIDDDLLVTLKQKCIETLLSLKNI